VSSQLDRLRRVITQHFVRAMYRWFLRTDENKWKAEIHLSFAVSYLGEMNEESHERKETTGQGGTWKPTN